MIHPLITAVFLCIPSVQNRSLFYFLIQGSSLLRINVNLQKGLFSFLSALALNLKWQNMKNISVIFYICAEVNIFKKKLIYSQLLPGVGV